MLSTSNSSSNSIPIPSIPEDEENDRHNRYSQLDVEHATKVAEWQESQMYQRLLNGMFLSCQRSDYHPKVLNSLENLMQNQALPVSLLEVSGQNEVSFRCRSCNSGRNGGMVETMEAMIVSPDCFCSSISSCTRRRSSPASLPSWNCTLKRSRSTLAMIGAAPEALRQESKSSGDEEEDGLMFDFEI